MQSLAQAVLQRETRAVARAATFIEADAESGRALLQALFPHTGNAIIVGITGAPGVGKSTLVNRLISHWRSESLSVGVIAVDPSSPYSRGALLGDRIRMQSHHQDPGVFIRSMATRGQLGGLARSTLNLALLLDAAGYNVVLVETVGVGQDELEIAQLADVTVVTLVAGLGDDVQAAKAGIMEIADVFAVNKADLPGADKLVEAIHFVQTLGSPSAPGHAAPVCKVNAAEGDGITELCASIRSVFAAKGKQNGISHVWETRLRNQLRETILDSLPHTLLSEHAQLVARRVEDPYAAVTLLKAAIKASL